MIVSIFGQQSIHADDPELAKRTIGFTQFQTNLPGGRHPNISTMRARLINGDGSGSRAIAEELVDGPDTWTQFVGWSPDGQQAIVGRGWQDPENAKWEEEHKTFRMEPGKWMLDSCLVDMKSGRVVNLTAVERVSNYNGGLFFMPGGKTLGFTPLINGISKPYVMDLDGRNKKDLSGKDAGFTYGYSASPDGALISFHENYQIYIANKDGSEKRHIQTGNPFNFGPQWSSDGTWLLFVSGEHQHSNPYVVKRDGTGLKKLADIKGYQGWIAFLDVPDFHNGSSDIPVWSADGKSVFFTAKVGSNVELFQTTLDGNSEQITQSAEGTLHYHPTPSKDGKYLIIGSKRKGVRQLIVIRLSDRVEFPLTDLTAGWGAMWPHWRP
ncbi:hypothetical protein K2Y11_01445 [bacterium]|nr:hypothetical protein [bacterium]